MSEQHEDDIIPHQDEVEQVIEEQITEALAGGSSSGTPAVFVVLYVFFGSQHGGTQDHPLTGEDGVSAGDRVFVVGQIDPTEDGIYVAAVGAWARADDCPVDLVLPSGTLFVAPAGAFKRAGGINQGTNFGRSIFTNANEKVVGTNNLEAYAVSNDGAWGFVFADGQPQLQNADLDANGYSVKNLVDPTDPQDAATKAWVLAAIDAALNP